ncbi:VPA1267 family protein [Shewanella sp. 5_MG-2023]|uniref:VPA1267 family protein n=1 Tax=Shewanella sp. 5_MG-2023 TaxID=3062656 RepID=UPI0026E226B6|nr:VPA1267 family protein [Shewanella sp. 5_MG-2023]MDO6641893.1 VPA1267 family protein [Shewanella sp. 5_MG-2023]
MASGQQKAQQNLEAFEVWKATQTDDEFKQIVFRGQLNRIEVAKGISCGKSALNQNPALKKALKALEDELRGKGVLPPLTDAAKKNEGKPQAYDNTANRKLLDSKRVSSLEAENIELKAKVKELEKRLERFGELSETLSEMGLMPR